MARTDGNGTAAYERFVGRAALDQNVIGVVLGGGRGKGLYSERSDFDVYVVFSDLDEHDVALQSPEGELIEVIPTSLDELQSIADHWLHPIRWNRYTFAHVVPVVDKSEGRLQPVLNQMEFVPLDDVEPHVRGSLDGYINATYRSLKNRADGEGQGSVLDAAESVAPLLDYLFGLDGRIRPFNKFLRWELDQHALPALDISPSEFLSSLLLVGSGDADAQRRMFLHVERTAAGTSRMDVIDAWGEHALAVLHGPG